MNSTKSERRKPRWKWIYRLLNRTQNSDDEVRLSNWTTLLAFSHQFPKHTYSIDYRCVHTEKNLPSCWRPPTAHFSNSNTIIVLFSPAHRPTYCTVLSLSLFPRICPIRPLRRPFVNRPPPNLHVQELEIIFFLLDHTT